MKKLLLSLAVAMTIFMSVSNAHAICAGRILNPITDVRWQCLMPFIIGPLEAGSSGNPLADKIDHLTSSRSPVCFCVMPPPIFYRIGFPFAFREAIRITEMTKDPFCFPSIGFGLSQSPWGMGGPKDQDSDGRNYNNTHMWNFVPLALMRIATDIGCLQNSLEEMQFSNVYMSEYDPLKKSSNASLMVSPDALLFNNPIATLACEIPDAIATIGEATIPPLYWCVGGHSIFPLSGHTTKATSYVDASTIAAAKDIFYMHRLGQMWGFMGNQGLCQKYLMPIPNWLQYRIQAAQPIPDWGCRRVGHYPLLWNQAKNPPIPGQADNLSNILWRVRQCCAF